MANSWGLGSVFVARAETASDFSDDDKNCCCKKSHAHTFQLLGNRISATDGNREENREPSRRLTNSYSTNFTQYDREGGQQRAAFASTAPQETQKTHNGGEVFFHLLFFARLYSSFRGGTSSSPGGNQLFSLHDFFLPNLDSPSKLFLLGGVSLNLSTGANDADKVGQLGFLLPRNAPQNRRTHYQKIYIPGKKKTSPSLSHTNTLSNRRAGRFHTRDFLHAAEKRNSVVRMLGIFFTSTRHGADDGSGTNS